MRRVHTVRTVDVELYEYRLLPEFKPKTLPLRLKMTPMARHSRPPDHVAIRRAVAERLRQIRE